MNLQLQSTAVADPPRFDLEAMVAQRSAALDPSLKGAFVAYDRAAANLDRLLTGQALCVTTGQQPGLLTGPLYTVYKALSAVSLAHAAEEHLGRPVVPVFWVAGDDHDFAEVNHLHIVTVGNSLERITLREREPAAPQRPMYQEPVGDDIDHVLDILVRETPDTEYRPDILDWIRRHYRASADVASAFASSLAELLGRFGLIVFQPTHQAAKQASSTWLFRALQDAVDLNRALEARARDLKQAGYPAPIAIGEEATTVMIEAELGRDRLVIDGNGFKTRRSGERWTMEQLREISQEEPQRLSANVLLRPVVEAALLPTLAYIGGPSEIAYLPQAEPLYNALGIKPQATVARWGARVVEGRIAKVLDKYDITASELGAPEGQLESRLVRDQIPDDASRALGHLRKTLDEDYGLLEQAVADVDRTLQKPVQAAHHNALRSLADVEKRLISQLKKRNDTVVQQLEKARINLMPLGKPQERVLNAVPYLIRYGQAFIDLAHASCGEWAGRLETGKSQT